MSPEDQQRIGLLAGMAFVPGSPIRDKQIFAGRMHQIRQAVDAINQQGRSVLIYGERGVGKTSLANVLDDFYLSAKHARIISPHVACDSEDSFTSIWDKILKEMNKPHEGITLSDSAWDGIETVVRESSGGLTPHSIKSIAEIVAKTHLLIPIIDEFDRIQDPYCIAQFTDLIKYISDHVSNTTIILVGVGDTVDDLVKEHASIERALEQILMPRMAAGESSEILQHGEQATGIKFEPDATELLISIAKGLPHYVHLMGLHATRAAVDEGRWTVSVLNVETATAGAIAGSHQSLLRAYHSATSSPRPDNLYKQAILACALARTDDLGYFAAADVREPMSTIMVRQYDIPSYSQHLTQFCSSERGEALQRTGSERRWRFRFKNPLLQPFVVMQGLKDKHIRREQLVGRIV